MDIPTASKNVYPCESHELLEAVHAASRSSIHNFLPFSVCFFSHHIFVYWYRFVTLSIAYFCPMCMYMVSISRLDYQCNHSSLIYLLKTRWKDELCITVT